MKTIGIIGGMGWEGSACYYRTMNREVRARLGGWHSARIILDSLDFDSIAQAKNHREFSQVRTSLVESAQRLEVAGADVLVMACNTVHRFSRAVEDAISIPLLHIADTAGAALVSDKHRRVGILGTRATMQGAFYASRLAQRFDLDIVTPCQESAKTVNHLVLHELASGLAPKSTKEALDSVIEELAVHECTAVLLACTEFGLVYESDKGIVQSAQIPLYDTAVIHSIAAVDFALESP